ncbi:hypothetical protein XcmpCFBP7700_01055 [Xanthomonas campestris]|nr:hypothetical protein XcmpCFBP7700_01055 [Xanthomonas campestris]
MRAMGRYRESFVARERAPTRRLVAVFMDARHARHITQLATPKAPRRCTTCMIQRQATLPLPATARVPKRPTLQQPPGTALANPHSQIPNPGPQNASFPSRTSTSINEVSASIASSSRLSAIQPA